MRPLLTIEGLHVALKRRHQNIPIIRGVDLEINPGEVVGIVGETGAGKSMTAQAMLNLLPRTATAEFARYDFLDEDFRSPAKIAYARGRRIGFVPQRPRGSLNPSFRVGDQLSNVLRRLQGMKRGAARAAARQLFERVQIADPDRTMRAYPHELSGGMCQRVCIAIALAGKPDLIIADEPTTGLDVTIQAEILRLLVNIINEQGSACILITHDLGVVAEVCQRVNVMYAGRIVNLGNTVELYQQALHPYADRLIGMARSLDGREQPQEIPGTVPNPGDPLDACAFAPRCLRATEECRTQEPPPARAGDQLAFCHHPLVATTRGTL